MLALAGKDSRLRIEQSRLEHDHEKTMEPNMKDPKAVKGLARGRVGRPRAQREVPVMRRSRTPALAHRELHCRRRPPRRYGMQAWRRSDEAFRPIAVGEPVPESPFERWAATARSPPVNRHAPARVTGAPGQKEFRRSRRFSESSAREGLRSSSASTRRR